MSFVPIAVYIQQIENKITTILPSTPILIALYQAATKLICKNKNIQEKLLSRFRRMREFEEMKLQKIQ